jgi:hypothetical protein
MCEWHVEFNIISLQAFIDLWWNASISREFTPFWDKLL